MTAMQLDGRAGCASPGWLLLLLCQSTVKLFAALDSNFAKLKKLSISCHDEVFS